MTGVQTCALPILLMASPELGYPFFLPPGVPPERARALKAAFSAMLKDPEFAAELARHGLEFSPMEGEPMQAMIAGLYRTRAATIARVRELAVSRDAK